MVNATSSKTISGDNVLIEPHHAIKNHSIFNRLSGFFEVAFSSKIFSFSEVKHKVAKLFVLKTQKKILTINRVASNQMELLQKGQQQNLLIIQDQLKERRIPLNCANTAQPNDLNDLNHQDIQKYAIYLDSLYPNQNRGENLREFLLNDVKKITFLDLSKNLQSCVRHLDSLLTQDYEIGFLPEKSSKWLAELALPYLSNLPVDYFHHNNNNCSTQSKFKSDSHQWVVFDDASYSGKQLLEVIQGIQEQLISQEKKGDLFLVVPFTSSVAEEYLVTELCEQVKRLPKADPSFYKKLRKINIHLITSDQKIKVMKDIYPESLDPTGITFTEWKIPDLFSLSRTVSGKHEIINSDGTKTLVSFVTNHPPCYKSVKGS